MNPTQLFAALAGIPRLDGAACKGNPAPFDPQDEDESDEAAQARHAEALQICAACPALTACEQWVDSLEEPPVGGVWAGRWFPTPKRRKREAS